MASDVKSEGFDVSMERKTRVDISKTSATSRFHCHQSKFPCHKVVISAGSGFFENACKTDQTVARTGIITLPEENPSDVRAVLHYLYHGSYDFFYAPESAEGSAQESWFHRAVRVYIMANKLVVPGLKQHTCLQIEKHFSLSDAEHEQFLPALELAFTKTAAQDQLQKALLELIDGRQMGLLVGKGDEVDKTLARIPALAIGLALGLAQYDDLTYRLLFQPPTRGFSRHWALSTGSASTTLSPPSPSPEQSAPTRRLFSTSLRTLKTSTHPPETSTHDIPSSDLNQNVTREEKRVYDASLASSREKQARSPWLRQGSDTPPVSRPRRASAMTKGKLLTTPTRLFKLILPLTTRDVNEDRKDIEPLALLVHPSQPLSYLERLIQAELPTIKPTGGGAEKIPEVNFRAEDAMRDEDGKASGGGDSAEVKAKRLEEEEGQEDATHTHLRGRSPDSARKLRGGPGEGGVESYSPHSVGEAGMDDDPANFVRWSKSTEIGDFVRDASRGSEFAVEIEGAPEQIMVGVPTFGDRTYYLRLRLRKKAGEISKMADVKRDCDIAAHHYSQRVAYVGFGLLSGWMGIVAWLTFETSLGWDVMEPVTYLVGLGGFLGGYGWFLAHNREASYRSAMNITVSRRQQHLYESKGFDLAKFNYLVEEGNSLRKEIRAVASEYDVDWDERRDAHDETVIEALKEARTKKKAAKAKKDDDDDDDDD